jgi:hypothetical protein
MNAGIPPRQDFSAFQRVHLTLPLRRIGNRARTMTMCRSSPNVENAWLTSAGAGHRSCEVTGARLGGETAVQARGEAAQCLGAEQPQPPRRSLRHDRAARQG